MRRKTVFWGAGEVGRLSMHYAVLRDMDIDCIIDIDSRKWGSEFYGTKVYPPERLLDLGSDVEVIVTVGSEWQNDVISKLSDMGFTYGIDVFTYYDKFFEGTIPSCAIPGFIDLDDEFALVKTITDCPLVVDKSNSHIYRAIPGKELEHFRAVYERINYSEKLREIIVPTSIVEHEYLKRLSPLVFKHEYLRPISYAREWPPAMFRDYVLFMLDFISELDKSGLGLDDQSADNVTFNKGRFLYIDYSAIRLNKTSLFIMQKFIELHINALIMIIKNPLKGYMLLNNRSLIIGDKDLVGYLSDTEQREYHNMLSECLDLVAKGLVAESCQQLIQYINGFTAQLAIISDWYGYQDDLYQSINDPSAWTDKQKSVIELINRAGPKTMLDLAGNMGWYCIAKSKDLEYAITSDADLGISDKAYNMVRQFNLTNVLPVCFNLISPTPAYFHWFYSYTDVIRPDLKSAIERFRCDLVLALAIEHHLALSQGLSFEEIVNQLALYTNKHLIIEFVDRDDPAVTQYLKINEVFRTAWYTKERFEAALEKTFKIIDTAPSNVNTRVLYLCEKM